ncbi:MAG: hypothetical protein ACI9F2_000457 [Lysobacterales bacterium]|jgi:uncharacterized protein (DUF2237 family)
MEFGKNVLGGPLKACCKFPITGYMRDGYCRMVPSDLGQHTICVEMTDEFLEFSKSAGNDLSTPIEEYEFPGLIAGDRWCLCAQRWVQAYEAGVAPKVVLSASDESMLQLVPLEILKKHAASEEELRL